MNVYQVKNAIRNTECADYIYSGLYCSEPIMSKDDEGEIIDNYIIYSRSGDCSKVSAPICVFGINSKKEQTVYVKNGTPEQFGEQFYQETFEDDEVMKHSRQIYLELFPLVRDMYFSEKNVDLKVVESYVDALRIMSGNMVFTFCRQLFPAFFEWADTSVN